MSVTLRIIIAPTATSADEVIGAYPATELITGKKISASRKQIPTTTAVSPVRPPASTPTVLYT